MCIWEAAGSFYARQGDGRSLGYHMYCDGFRWDMPNGCRKAVMAVAVAVLLEIGSISICDDHHRESRRTRHRDRKTAPRIVTVQGPSVQAAPQDTIDETQDT